MQVMLGLNVLLHCDVLIGDGHHAGHVVICRLGLYLHLAQSSMSVANFEDTRISTCRVLGCGDLGGKCSEI